VYPEEATGISSSEQELEPRPKTLYRGYISNERDEAVPTRSNKEILQKTFESGKNPHDEGLANMFIWSTPNENYAKKVVAMRFLVKMAIDSEYEGKVRDGTAGLPTLAEYKVDSETKLYDAAGKVLVPLNEGTSEQIIIEEVPDRNLVKKPITPDSLNSLIERFYKKVGEGGVDTLGRATIMLDHLAHTDFIRKKNYDFGEATYGEAIKQAYDYYVGMGVGRMQAEELLAKGLFAGSTVMGELASSTQFTEPTQG